LKILRWFVLSFIYMTRLPIKTKFDVTENDVSKTSIFFAFTSLFIGAFMYLFYYIFTLIGFDIFAIVISLAAGVIMTGGLHVDGFIDCADAFFVSDSKERALEILKDSRVGAYGAIACVFLFIVKIALLFELSITGASMLFAIICMPIAAKIPVLVVAYFSKYAREQGSGKSIITQMKLHEMLISYLFILAILMFCFKENGLIIFISMIALGFIYTSIGKKKIGGATGDLLGSANESGEILFLVLIFILNKFGGFTF